MAIALRGAGVTGTGTAGTCTVTLSGITGLAQNDVVVLFIGISSTSGAADPTVPGTWTDCGKGKVLNSASTGAVRCYTKVMGASPDTSVAVTGGAAGDGVSAVAFAFSGVDTANIMSTAVISATGSSTNPNPPSITPAHNDATLLIFGYSPIRDTSPSGTVTNFLPATPVNTNANATRPITVAGAYRILTGGTGTPVDPAAFTTWTTSAWVTFSVALRAGLGVITGTLALTQAADTISAAGSSDVLGALGLTEANNTISAAGGPVAVGALSATEAEDTISATGTVGDPIITGALNVTEANDTIVATGGPVVRGTLAVTEANDTITATATVVVRGTLAVTEANDTITATGGPVVRGTLAVTEANDTITATATVVVRGTLAVTEANDTLVAAGGPVVRGTLAVTEAADTLAGAATVISGISGVLNVTEADDTLTAAGALVVGGTLGLIEADDTLVAAGEIAAAAVIGTLAVIQDAQTIEATGFVEPFTEVVGTLAITQDDQALVAAGHANQFISLDFLAEPDFVIRPEIRAFEVSGERREVEVLADVCYTAIPAEDKRLVVPEEDRTIKVLAEVWRVVVPTENRVLVVVGEDRTIEVPGEWRMSDVVGIEATYGGRQAALDDQLRILAR